MPPAPSRHLVLEASASSCQLPVGQQIKAVHAFREMMPVFRHARCFNCHGAFDITSERHEGSDFARNSGLDPRALLTAAERAALHEGCGVCHSQVQGEMTRLDGTRLAGWLVAPQPMLWVGKSDERLCLDMKKFEAVGDSFVDHVDTDHGEIKFIEAAFIGDRALTAADMRKYGVKRERPPGSKAELVTKARKWVELLDGQWKESPDCGCVLPKIRLKVQHQSTIDPGHPTHRAGFIGFSGDAEFEVTLEAVHEAQGRVWYRGENSLVRQLRTYHVAQGCRGSASQAEEWQWSAEVDTSSAEMRLHWGFTTSDEKGESVCTRGGVVSRMDLDPSIYDGGGPEPIVMPLDSGATKRVTSSEPYGSGRASLVVQVVGVPGD